MENSPRVPRMTNVWLAIAASIGILAVGGIGIGVYIFNKGLITTPTLGFLSSPIKVTSKVEGYTLQVTDTNVFTYEIGRSIEDYRVEVVLWPFRIGDNATYQEGNLVSSHKNSVDKKNKVVTVDVYVVPELFTSLDKVSWEVSFAVLRSMITMRGGDRYVVGVEAGREVAELIISKKQSSGTYPIEVTKKTTK